MREVISIITLTIIVLFSTVAFAHDNKKVVVIPLGKSDPNLKPENIKAGTTIFGETGTYPLAGVEKTGQTTSYATGDDGDLEKGITFPNPRFTDHSNGTVTDNLTGLIWLKNANCAGTTRNWSTALSDVAQLNTTGQMNSNDCGDTSNGGSSQTDWRLPNVKELQSLIDYNTWNPALPTGHPFSSVVSHIHWTSSTDAPNTDLAWTVHVLHGSVDDLNKTNFYYVWPVRGGN